MAGRRGLELEASNQAHWFPVSGQMKRKEKLNYCHCRCPTFTIEAISYKGDQAILFYLDGLAKRRSTVRVQRVLCLAYATS